MGKIKVCNDTSGKLFRKEGNAGEYRDIQKLTGRGEKYVIKIDYNDTYQEDMIDSSPSGRKVFITSDDCCDYYRVTIDTEIVRFIAAAQVAMDEKLNMVHARVEGLDSYLRRDRRGSKSELLIFIMVLLQAAILVHAVVSAA